jgi:hypothetical protein
MQRTITESFQFSNDATADIRERSVTVRDKSGDASLIFELSNLPADQVAYAVRSYINGQRWVYSDNEADKVANLERAKSILECAQRAVEYLTPKSAETVAN